MDMVIDFPGGTRVDAHFGTFTVETDQPPTASAPTPFELFLSSIDCYSFGPGGSKPLSWICTAGLRRTAAMYSPNLNDRVRASLEVIRHYLLETGFNHSDGQGGQRSWFAASRSVDPRLATIEAWEEASAQDPLFVLEVPWLPTGLTLGQVAFNLVADAKGLQAKLSTGALAGLGQFTPVRAEASATLVGDKATFKAHFTGADQPIDLALTGKADLAKTSRSRRGSASTGR